jgi:hypothetical protein
MNKPLMIIIIYFFAVFFLSRLFIPNLGFKKGKLPNKIPKEFEKIINQIKKKSKNKEYFAINIYNYLSNRFYSKPLSTWTNFNSLFIKDMNKLWQRKLLHCHQLNNFYRIFLIKSKFFKEEDIKIIHKFCMFNIHQYLKIKINNKSVKVDLFAKNLGYKFGEALPYLYNPFKSKNDI